MAENPLLRNQIAGTSGCCAQAMGGHVVATPPSSGWQAWRGRVPRRLAVIPGFEYLPAVPVGKLAGGAALAAVTI